MAKNNQRDPNLRAATVARVDQLVKGGMSKAAAFAKISTETGRAKDAVQMLYYRAIRAAKAAKGPKDKGGPAKAAPATPAPAAARKAQRRPARKPGAGARSTDFLAVLKGVENAINSLLIYFEKTMAENETLKEQAKRLQAITSLVRGR